MPAESFSAMLSWHRPLLHRGVGVPVALDVVLPSGRHRPSTADCEERFFTQTLDHFRHIPASGGEDEHEDDDSFQQRYFLCSEYWKTANGGSAHSENGDCARSENGAGFGKGGSRGGDNAASDALGPIFFYAGNEADVSLYVGASGLMWENAPEFKALLVFAEHRFYGESLPFGAPDKRREFLRQDRASAGCVFVILVGQPLADYACLITALKQDLGAEGSPVVAFGGSYGGMLASWFRLKYPHIVHGAIAASAPVLALEGLRRPTPDPEMFAETVTKAAGPAGGAAESCADNVRYAFSAMLPHADNENAVGKGGAKLRGAGGALTSGAAVADVARKLRVCAGQEPQGDDAIWQLAWWARSAFDYLAMGNFPYATGYILNSNDGVELPPWPLREACSYLADPALQTADDDALLGALADAIGVYYNATGELGCFSPAAGANNASSVDAENWNWQACTEMSMPMATDGKRDMFWVSDWDAAAQAAQCMEQFGVSPREGWGAAEYGGYDSWSQVTNVVFSNGRLDPWSEMGVVDQKKAGSGVKVIMMDQAAHHLDLFFEHPLDPPDVLDARKVEMDMVEEWVDKAYRAYGGAFAPQDGDVGSKDRDPRVNTVLG
ncbi:unnamed protein product [Pylaiella littoralis]